MFEQVDSPTFIDVTVIHIAIYLLIPVLLGNNRLRALISASFTFSIINLAHLPLVYFMLAAISHLFTTQSYLDVFRQNPLLYYIAIFFSNIVITVCCLFAARCLRETSKKPPLILYVIFNLLFVLFPLAVLVWYEGILAELMSIPFLASAFLCSFFLGIVLFLFYLYTRLTLDNHAAGIKETGSSLLQDRKVDEYKPFIQRLSRRELEVIESVLAGNVSYKELSAALNISINTIKAHLKHIYKTTGVSNIAALSSLFHGFTSNHPKITS